MTARTTSLAVTPAGSVPSTLTARVRNGLSGRGWVASTCSTSLVPMPKARAPKAPWVEVWLSPQTTVMPGWVSPSCGPTTCTMPWSASPMGYRRTPNSSQLRRRVSTWVRLTGSVIGPGVVGTLWSSVASVRSGRRTLRPSRRSPSNAWGLVTSCSRCRSMYRRSGSPSARRTTCASHTFSASVPAMFCPPSPRRGELSFREVRALCRVGELASQAMRRQYQRMDTSSGVGVLDKAAIVLGALEAGPSTLAQLVGATGLARPTAHRLAVALEHHRLVSRDMQGRFVLGPRLGELASAAGEDRLLAAAGPVLGALRDHTNESAQLFRRQGDQRICVAAAERPVGLRDSIPVGATLSMLAGSAAQVLLAWEEPDRLHRGLQGASFTATALSGVRRRGWAQSVAEREAGVASVSAPVRGPSGRVVAAVSISGPIERLSRQPGRLHAATVVAGANKLTEVLRRAQQANQPA